MPIIQEGGFFPRIFFKGWCKWYNKLGDKMYYFDNAATTRAYPEVADTMVKYLREEYFNPSALYKKGLDLEKDIEEARKIVAKKLGARPDEIYFTPGGTWSNNMVLRSVLGKNTKGLVVTSMMEHSSVYLTIDKLAKNRDIIYLPVDEDGKIDLEELKDLVEREDIDLVSLMHVNNELGTINPIGEIGQILKDKDILFHVDGVQGFCKYDLDLDGSGVDFYTFSGHKINGPKGIGGLYIRKGLSLDPLSIGGGQEKGLVSGTENVPGIMGLAEAVRLKDEKKNEDYAKVKEIYDYLRDELGKMEGSRINSPEDGSVYILNASFKDIRSEVLIHMMSDDGYLLSAGSACSKTKGSRPLEAIGLAEAYKNGPIRISFSYESTMEDAKGLLEALKKNIEEIRKIIRS